MASATSGTGQHVRCGSKLDHSETAGFIPFTRLEFWVPFFDPQPCVPFLGEAPFLVVFNGKP